MSVPMALWMVAGLLMTVGLSGWLAGSTAQRGWALGVLLLACGLLCVPIRTTAAVPAGVPPQGGSSISLQDAVVWIIVALGCLCWILPHLRRNQPQPGQPAVATRSAEVIVIDQAPAEVETPMQQGWLT